jgi:hypothetical protein
MTKHIIIKTPKMEELGEEAFKNCIRELETYESFDISEPFAQIFAYFAIKE